MTRAELEGLLAGRSSRKVANNTYLRRDLETLTVRLHATDIVTWKGGVCTLDTGGWQTSTTRDRLNRFGPVPIYQSGGVWYVGGYGGKVVFKDGMTVTDDGSLGGVGNEVETMNLRKAIRKYCAGFAKALLDGEIEEPGAGDCFDCQLREIKTGLPLHELPGAGEHTRDHLLMHFEESYYVPSLMYRAVEWCTENKGAGPLWGSWMIEMMRGEMPFHRATNDNWHRNQYARFLSKYLKHVFGLPR